MKTKSDGGVDPEGGRREGRTPKDEAAGGANACRGMLALAAACPARITAERPATARHMSCAYARGKGPAAPSRIRSVPRKARSRSRSCAKSIGVLAVYASKWGWAHWAGGREGERGGEREGERASARERVSGKAREGEGERESERGREREREREREGEREREREGESERASERAREREREGERESERERESESERARERDFRWFG